jgi:hypothetical protein
MNIIKIFKKMIWMATLLHVIINNSKAAKAAQAAKK